MVVKERAEVKHDITNAEYSGEEPQSSDFELS